MAQQVPFIDRENELALIDALIKEWGTRKVLCIHGDGGIGKTRLLQEVRQRYAKLGGAQVLLIITDIIDLDDSTFHIPQNLGRKIAQMLDEKVFGPYLQALLDWRKMAVAGVSSERLAQEGLTINQTFVGCFNTVSAQQRVVWFMDTTDALKGTDVWDYLIQILVQPQNSLLLMAGRNARTVGETLRARLGEDIQIVDLLPLEPSSGESYLQQKQELLHITLESDLARKILLLALGRPILIDLATEWIGREIPFDWLINSSLEELESLPEDAREQRQKDFERQLIHHITATRSPMDSLILLLSRVYPLDVEMIAYLLGKSRGEADILFKAAQMYTFVKSLPDGRIALHDEMRRMVNEYVWPEVDPSSDRRHRDSRLAAEYLERRVHTLTQLRRQLEAAEEKAHKEEDAQAELSAFLAHEDLERELWVLKGQQLNHSLFVDVAQGVKTFASMFDEATQTQRLRFREPLLIQVQQYIDRLSSEQLYELDSRRVKHWLGYGQYPQAIELATAILQSSSTLPEQQVDMLIQRGNAEIRLGNVRKGISDFEEAATVSESLNSRPWIIRAKNALGWAYRLIGELSRATEYYREAQALCLDSGTMGDDYGWILNNLTFALSYQDRRNALGFGRSAVDYWRSIGNEIGLGAAYLVLGTVYYQNALYAKALEMLQEALSIFEPLKFQDWTGQIYSWRGAVYQDLGELDKAENDLKKSLEVGPRNIDAMTLNRLGRVYMSKKEWDLAERYILQSYKRAQEIPDFVYWLGALARLITIAAMRQQYQRLQEFSQELHDCLAKIGTSDGNSLGIAYLGLARLAMGQEDVDTTLEYLEKGITLITEYGAYAGTDVLTRLAYIEDQQFDQVDPETIRRIGQVLRDVFRKKETQNIAYGVVTPVMYRWANWPRRTGEGQ